MLPVEDQRAHREMDRYSNEAEENRPTDLLVPRLDLDISEDESGFDHINKMFSIENQNQLMETHKTANEPICTNSGRKSEKRDLCSTCNMDITSKLNDSSVEMIDIDSGDGQVNYKTILLNHLEFLDSLEHSEEGSNGRIRKSNELGVKKQWIESKTEKVKSWERKGQVAENELLQLSMQILDKYVIALSLKANELNRVRNDLCDEMSNNSQLKESIVECEKIIAEMAGSLQKKSKQNNEEHRSHNENIKQTKKEDMKLGVRSQAEFPHARSVESVLRSKQKSMFDTGLTQPYHEKKKLKRLVQNMEGDYYNAFKNDKMNDLNKRLKEINQQRPRGENEMKQLNQNDLREGNSRYKNEKIGLESFLEEKDSTVNERGRNIIRSLMEELTLKGKQLDELQGRYEDQIVIAQIFRIFLSEIERETDITNNKWFKWLNDELEQKGTECGDMSVVETENVSKSEKYKWRSEHKSMNDLATSRIMPESLKTVAILQIEDMWTEQILCYESNIEKMKETQNMRENLIKTRQQLERTIEENLKLKETIKNRQLFTNCQCKDFGEVSDIELALMKEKQEATLLSKELQQCHVIQQNNEREIEMLNVSAKSEKTNEYCFITKGSMMNFKTQMQKVRQENKYLLNYIDKMEEKMSKLNREMETCKAINNDLKEWRKHLSKRCVQMKVDVNSKNCSVRQLKDVIRQLKVKNENGREEIVDKGYEIAMCKAKLEKTEQRLSQMEEMNMKLENDNSTLREKLFKTHYDLQKSLDLIYEMNLRFKNVDEKFKNNEKEIKSLSDDLVKTEDELKRLNDSKRMVELENEKLIENWGKIKNEKEGELRNRNEKQSNELIKHPIKLVNIEHQFMEEEINATRRLHDLLTLKEEIKQFKSKMENILGENDLDKIEKEIKKVKEKEIMLCKENSDLKSMREGADNKSSIFQNQINELRLQVKEIEEENCQIYDELKLKENEIEFKDCLLSELKIKLEKQLSEHPSTSLQENFGILKTVKDDTGLNKINECRMKFDISSKLKGNAEFDNKVHNGNTNSETERWSDENGGRTRNYASDATSQNELKGELMIGQIKPNLLPDDLDTANMISFASKQQNEVALHDPLNESTCKDEILGLSKEQDKNASDENVRGPANKRTWLSIETERKEQLARKGDDMFAEDNWKKQTTDKERKRCQNLTDAAAELKKLVEQDL